MATTGINRALLVALLLAIALVASGSVTPTLLNLATEVKGILGHANGGTDVSSPGTLGNVLTSTGSAWASQSPGSGLFNPNSVVLFDDFCNNSAGSTLNWNALTGAGMTTAQLTSDETLNHPCTIKIGTTTNTNWGYFILGVGNTGNEAWNFSTYIFSQYSSLEVTSSVANSAIRFGGFLNRGVANSDGMFFEASSTLNGNANWWCVTSIAGVRTTADSGIASTAWHTLEMDASGSGMAGAVTWKIDGTQVCNAQTTVNASQVALGFGINNTGGNGFFPIDYYRLNMTTSGR